MPREVILYANEKFRKRLKKMDWNLSTLQDYLNRSPIPHTYYPNSFILYNVLLKIYKILLCIKFFGLSMDLST